MAYLTPLREYFLTGVNLNSLNTDVGIFSGLPAKYRTFRFTVYEASTSLTTATIGLYTAAAGGGTALIAPSALTGCTAATKFVDVTYTVSGDYRTESSLYLRNVTPQGGAATATFRLEIQYFL